MDADEMRVLVCTGFFKTSGKYTLLFAVISFFLFIATILGNTLILVALRKESSLHPPSKLLYSCLAITDLLVGLIVGPAAAVHYMNWTINLGRGMDLCVYSAAIGAVNFTILTSVSLLTLTAISVDRLLALLLKLRYRQVVTLRRIHAFVIYAWIPGIAYAIMLFLEYSIAKMYGYTLQARCLLVSASCYSKIFLTLHRHKTEVQVHVHQRQPNERVPLNIRRYRKTVCTGIWILMTLVVCYLPHIIVTAIFTSNGPFPLLPALWGISGALVFLNSSLNPLLYCWRIREVRQAVKMTIRQVLCLSD
ncbi:melanocyte-stimulating hormone receptor-like [Oculina patagonica]